MIMALNATFNIRHKEQFQFVFPCVFLAYTTLKLWVRVMMFNVTLKQLIASHRQA
jgi:hypothetical protein